MHIHALHIISSIITKASSGITRKANVASHKIILRHKSEQNGKLSGSSLFKQMRPRSYFQPFLCHSLSRISIRWESRPQEIIPGTTSSSWPLFLLVVVQLAVTVVAEDRVGQEELLVAVPAVPVFLVSQGTEQTEHKHPKKAKHS